MTQFAGKVRSRLTFGGLGLVETSYRPGQLIHSHDHDRPMIVLILGGAMTEHVLGRALHCPAGTVLFHPAGEIHSHRFGASRSQCLVLTVEPFWLDRVQVERGLVPESPVSRCDEATTGAARLLHGEFRRGMAASRAAIDGLALTLIATISRIDAPIERRPRFLNSVLERLRDDVATDVDLTSLAEIAGVSPEHLARTFRQQLGRTVGEYVRQLKVERARHELAHARTPLALLALELGFCDQSHFTRTFRSLVGCTPGEYRRKAQRLRDIA